MTDRLVFTFTLKGMPGLKHSRNIINLPWYHGILDILKADEGVLIIEKACCADNSSRTACTRLCMASSHPLDFL